MTIESIAADIAARVPAMVQDSPTNNAELITKLISHYMDYDRKTTYQRALREIREGMMNNAIAKQTAALN